MINQNGKLRVATANSVYHLGEASEDGSRSVVKDGASLGFERGILLGRCDSTFLGADVDMEKPIVTGHGMAIMPVPGMGGQAWSTSKIISIENE